MKKYKPNDEMSEIQVLRTDVISTTKTVKMQRFLAAIL